MELSGLRVIPTGAAIADRPAYDLAGVDLSGRPIEVSILSRPGRTLLAFLAVDCFGCEVFWQGIGDPATLPASPDLARVVVTKGPDAMSSAKASDKLTDLSGVPVLVSDEAWTDYAVLSYPSFVVVDGSSGKVIGETVATGWEDVGAMIASIGS